jgi:hypothetical protein
VLLWQLADERLWTLVAKMRALTLQLTWSALARPA